VRRPSTGCVDSSALVARSLRESSEKPLAEALGLLDRRGDRAARVRRSTVEAWVALAAGVVIGVDEVVPAPVCEPSRPAASRPARSKVAALGESRSADAG
jgi:hypothetical protein